MKLPGDGRVCSDVEDKLQNLLINDAAWVVQRNLLAGAEQRGPLASLRGPDQLVRMPPSV